MRKFLTVILFLKLIATIYLVKSGSSLSIFRLYANLKSEFIYYSSTESSSAAVSMILSRYDGQIAKAAHDKDMQELGKWTRYFNEKLMDGYHMFEIAVDIDSITDSELTEINIWFEKNPKNFLIVDGVNAPAKVAEIFRFYRDQVYIKLYSWEELKIARELNFLASMLDGDVIIKQAEGVEKLKKYQGFYVNFKANRLSHSLDILEMLRIKGVEVYLDDVRDSLTEESSKKYLCKAADYFYGIYSTVKINKNFQCPQGQKNE